MIRKKFDFCFRKKECKLSTEKYAKRLGFFDITAIGVSCSLNGIYIMIGTAVKNDSGPAIIFSFLIAGFTTLLCGLFYSELADRVPRSGSAYTYIYVTIGELFAFIMGVSSDARALSQNIDLLVDNRISNFFIANKITNNFYLFSTYPDILSFVIIMFITGILLFRVEESSLFNKLVNFSNIFLIALILVAGGFYMDIKNWNIKIEEIKNFLNVTYPGNDVVNNASLPLTTTEIESAETFGKGGFMPYGLSGVINGSAKCFYAYLGFDAITSTSSESKNPKRHIPLALLTAILICLVIFIALSTVLSLMMPYYLVDEKAPFMFAFEYVNLKWPKYVVTLSIILSLVTSIYAEIYVISRIINAMAADGLIFKFLSFIYKRYKSPITATLTSGIFSGLFSLLFDLEKLIDLMALIGLASYCLVSICVILLRYKIDESHHSIDSAAPLMKRSQASQSSTLPILKSNDSNNGEKFLELSFKDDISIPDSNKSKKIVYALTFICSINVIAISLLVRLTQSMTFRSPTLYITGFLIALLIAKLVVIWQQPQCQNEDLLKIPFVPFAPIVSFSINFYLMLTLSLELWIFAGLWILIGLIIYFTYGIRKSEENSNNKAKEVFIIN